MKVVPSVRLSVAIVACYNDYDHSGTGMMSYRIMECLEGN